MIFARGEEVGLEEKELSLPRKDDTAKLHRAKLLPEKTMVII
jgi:hypothetical protein